MRIAIILGTRPEIIKMSPVIRECERRGLDFFILHTGQHYDFALDEVFFRDLDLPQPRYNLRIGSASHGMQTGRILIGIEEVLIQERPDVVLVQGDTNTVVAGALAAVKLHIPVGHVEAGLRSYDRQMPEEINRIVADHISDYLFAPTEKARGILLREGIPDEQISVTGNTIVDAVYQNLALAERERDILERLGLERGRYLLVTIHRQENVDYKERLDGILEGLRLVYESFRLPLLCPVHPRTRRRIREFGLQWPEGVRVIEPVGYLQFLLMERQARLVLTDSGGVQEEACILGVPCVTLRDNTERPETLEVGSNVLAGARSEVIVCRVGEMLDLTSGWPNPFGDGQAGKRIVDSVLGSEVVPWDMNRRTVASRGTWVME
ncbi:MAG TPA: UDP-N-acetylglucosamine 2-epimerase (non-hydrolyzing) [Thermoflexia bacterium]|nr:UDP-N-acetylglucosamine 2-epimerase (non-hydrolyzing) [Thermoflexia bacterium]